MTPKKPIQRSIEILIQPRGSGDGLKGMFYTNDFGDGAAEHPLDGHLTDSQGVTRRFFGRLSGVQFVPVETRGAPEKVARDVALYLAYQWFFGNALRDGKPWPKRIAKQGVLDLWAGRGFKGASEETHLNKRVKQGGKTVHGLSLMRYVCAGVSPDGAVIAAHEDVFDCRPGEYIGINGPGWFWQYGMETAIQGNFTAGANLSNP